MTYEYQNYIIRTTFCPFRTVTKSCPVQTVPACPVQIRAHCHIAVYIDSNNLFPCIMKLEQSVSDLQQKITTEQDTVQINAQDFDPDIDGPNPPPQTP